MDGGWVIPPNSPVIYRYAIRWRLPGGKWTAIDPDNSFVFWRDYKDAERAIQVWHEPAHPGYEFQIVAVELKNSMRQVGIYDWEKDDEPVIIRRKQ